MNKPPRPPVKPPTLTASVQRKVNQPATPLTRTTPVAPRVYGPQAKPNAAQQKTSHPSQIKGQAVAPPVYSPRPAPKVLQTKRAQHQRGAVRPEAGAARPTAPPVYRPQPTPSVLQRQAAQGSVRQPAKQTGSAPVPPPVYRSRPAPGVLQEKHAGSRQQTMRGIQIKVTPEAPAPGARTKHEPPVPQKAHARLNPDRAANQARVPGSSSTHVQAKMAVNAIQKTSGISGPASSRVIQAIVLKARELKPNPIKSKAPKEK